MGKVQHQANAILSYINKNEQMTISEAMELLDISDSTARRLFVTLEKSGLAFRVRGGIKRLPNGSIEYSYERQQMLHVAEKEAIGRSAARLVESGDSVFLDWGTTTSCLCEALTSRIKSGELERVVVFTNSLTNIVKLHPYCQTMCLGGKYREERRDFAGYMTEEAIKRLRFNKCFVCADGFSPSMGFMQFDFESARIDEIALLNSSERNILLDSSKYTLTATVNCTGGIMLDRLITDATPPASAQAAIREYVRQVLVCGPVEA